MGRAIALWSDCIVRGMQEAARADGVIFRRERKRSCGLGMHWTAWKRTGERLTIEQIDRPPCVRTTGCGPVLLLSTPDSLFTAQFWRDGQLRLELP